VCRYIHEKKKIKNTVILVRDKRGRAGGQTFVSTSMGFSRTAAAAAADPATCGWMRAQCPLSRCSPRQEHDSFDYALCNKHTAVSSWPGERVSYLFFFPGQPARPARQRAPAGRFTRRFLRFRNDPKTRDVVRGVFIYLFTVVVASSGWFDGTYAPRIYGLTKSRRKSVTRTFTDRWVPWKQETKPFLFDGN